MTKLEAVQVLRDAYRAIDTVLKSNVADKSQRTMLNISLGRLAIVGKQFTIIKEDK